MEEKDLICQSCGMPLSYDPEKGGTNTDKSKSDKYCSFCFTDGKFRDEGVTLQEKIDKNISIAVSRLNMSESQAREMAESIIPFLERWKS